MIKTIISNLLIYSLVIIFLHCDKKPQSINQMSIDQQQAWDIVYDKWYETYYTTCKKQFLIKDNCSDSNCLYMNVYLKISNKGKLLRYKIIEPFCSYNKKQIKIRECYINYFRSVVYPKQLRGKSFIVRLGDILKC